MTKIWTIRELERGFTLDIQTEVPGQRGVLSQFIERHAAEKLVYLVNRVLKDYENDKREEKQERELGDKTRMKPLAVLVTKLGFIGIGISLIFEGAWSHDLAIASVYTFCGTFSVIGGGFIED